MNSLSNHTQLFSDSIHSIFTLIRQHDHITRQAVSDRLNIPSTTLNRQFDKLIGAGLIAESGLAPSTGGRPASLYTVSQDKIFLLGLDVTSSEIRLVLTNLASEIITRTRVPAVPNTSADKFAEIVMSEAQTLLSDKKLSFSRVAGLGICHPDPEDHQDTSRSLYDEALRATLEAKLGMPASLLDSGHASLYAGLWLDPNLSDHTLFYFSAGHDLQSGLVFDGQFNTRHLKAVSAASLLTAGKTKSAYLALDSVATPAAMVEKFRKSKKNNKEDWNSFCKAAAQGKKKAGAVLEEAAEALAVVIYNALALSSASYLLLDGSSFSELPAYREKVIATIKALGSGFHLFEQSHDHTAAENPAFADQKRDPAKQPDVSETNSTRSVKLLENRYGDDLMAVGAAAYMLTQYVVISSGATSV